MRAGLGKVHCCLRKTVPGPGSGGVEGDGAGVGDEEVGHVGEGSGAVADGRWGGRGEVGEHGEKERLTVSCGGRSWSAARRLGVGASSKRWWSPG